MSKKSKDKLHLLCSQHTVMCHGYGKTIHFAECSPIKIDISSTKCQDKEILLKRAILKITGQKITSTL